MTIPSTDQLRRRIEQGLGSRSADLVLRGGRVFNMVTGELTLADVAICGDTIVAIDRDCTGTVAIDCRDRIIVPGFVDAHLHVESSLLTPWEFARSVLQRGTTTAICDPHEIANVLGVDGIRYFLACAETLPLDLRIMLPSCVPATELETSGARLEAADLASLRHHPAVLGLAEMMNFPGVLAGQPNVLAKLAAFAGAHVDGHAPLVRGRGLNGYLAAGIRTCHESTSLEEATEKLAKGMVVLLREGGIAKNMRLLAPLLNERTSPFLGLCTDDRSARDILREGHVDHGIRLAIAQGVSPLAAYRAASWSGANAFRLHDRGLVAPGWRADLVILDDLQECRVAKVLAGGAQVDAQMFAAGDPIPVVGGSSIRLAPVDASAFSIPADGPSGPVIGMRDGSLITEHLTLSLPYRDGRRHADSAQDVQKATVLCRHGVATVGRGFVQGFGLTGGAMASSVGHDSHNITVVGMDDADMAAAVNRVIALGGGFVAVRAGRILGELALPVAGLMSRLPFAEVCQGLEAAETGAESLGCRFVSPFLQLAFLALPVIPHLKLTDRGLVDVDRQILLAA